MKFQLLEKNIIEFIEKQNSILLALLISIICIFFALPPYFLNIDNSTWNTLFQQVNNPFSKIKIDAVSHQSKMTFRLFPVFIAKIFFLNKSFFIVLLHIIGVSLIWICLKISNQLFRTKYSSFIFTLSIAFLYFGKVSFIEQRGIFDGIALFLLLTCYQVKNPWLIFLLIQFAAWTDERALIVSSFIFLHFVDFKGFKIKLSTSSRLIILSWITYFIIRVYLSYFFGMKTTTGGISLKILALNFELFPLSFFSVFEGFWWCIIFFFYKLYHSNKVHFLSLIISLLISLIISYLVLDTTRSLAYTTILVFTALIYLKNHFEFVLTKNRLYLVLIINFLYPAYVVAGNQLVWVKPIILEVLFRYFTN